MSSSPTETKVVLVCGGAGYIGSHMCKALARSGFLPVALDNLSTGHRWAVRWGPLIEADLLDEAALRKAFEVHRFTAVMHFAARSLVAESVADPGLYFRTNVTGILNLLETMRAAKVTRLIFSSTAAVYGNPDYTPIDECHPTRPINPYGWSKLMAERVIAEYAQAHGLRAACLRYFNAAGADSEGEIGEAHEPETHLIPNVIKAALDPDAAPVTIFGSDYDTPDGTCIRDYIHVEDLCAAHLLAMEYLSRHDGTHVFNLGTGVGNSVAEVVAACQTQLDGKPGTVVVARRPGDPPRLVASAEKANEILGWEPHRSLTHAIVHAAAWHRLPTPSGTK